MTSLALVGLLVLCLLLAVQRPKHRVNSISWAIVLCCAIEAVVRVIR
jgi:hypothetical protein